MTDDEVVCVLNEAMLHDNMLLVTLCWRALSGDAQARYIVYLKTRP